MRRPDRINRDWWRRQFAQAPGLAMAGIFIGFSGTMTVLCGYRLGEPNGFGLLTAAGALAIEAFVDLSIPLYWRRLGFMMRVLFIAFFAVLLTYKLEAARRFAAENWGALDAATAKAAENYDIAKGRVETVRKRIADNADARAATVIQSDIDELLVEPKTDGCPVGVAWNGAVTQKICPKVAKLRGELARAKLRDQAQADLEPALEKWRNAAPVSAKPTQAEVGFPQLLLALIGISSTWTAAMATFSMIAFEGGAIYVPIMIERALREERRPAPVGDTLGEAQMRSPPQSDTAAGDDRASPVSPPGISPRAQRDKDELAAFLGDRSERAPGERVQASKLYAVYFQWKTERGEAPMKVQQFGTVLTKHLGLGKGKIAGKNWYLDLRLRHPAQGRKTGKHLQAVAA